MLVFALPEFDLWPPGQLRLVGVLIVLINASPLRTRRWPVFTGGMARRWQEHLQTVLAPGAVPSQTHDRERNTVTRAAIRLVRRKPRAFRELERCVPR